MLAWGGVGGQFPRNVSFKSCYIPCWATQQFSQSKSANFFFYGAKVSYFWNCIPFYSNRPSVHTKSVNPVTVTVSFLNCSPKRFKACPHESIQNLHICGFKNVRIRVDMGWVAKVSFTRLTLHHGNPKVSQSKCAFFCGGRGEGRGKPSCMAKQDHVLNRRGNLNSV